MPRWPWLGAPGKHVLREGHVVTFPERCNAVCHVQLYRGRERVRSSGDSPEARHGMRVSAEPL